MQTVSHWKALSMLVAGFVAGVAFVIACGTGRRGGGGSADDGGLWSGSDAEAQVGGECDQWEIVRLYFDDFEVTGDSVEGREVWLAPGGWEPYAEDSGAYYFRRCVR